MWKLTWAEWRYRWLTWSLLWVAVLALWFLVWRHTGVAEGSFWVSLGLLSLLPYVITLGANAGSFDRERRIHLWRSVNRTDLQIAAARLLWALVPWGLAVGMAVCAIWPAQAHMLRGGAYDVMAVLFSWSGECLMLAALLLCLERSLDRANMAAIAALICSLHFVLDPVLLMTARVTGMEPYVMNHAVHQSVATWTGGVVFYGLAALLAWLYVRQCTRTSASTTEGSV